jgi:REP element-mobilizing transposase RayT
LDEKYKDRYRASSTRLQNWDYGWNGAYFITICSKNRVNYFGDIVNGQSKLSPIGVVADVLWCEIKNHSQNVELGVFIVMPNHIHEILKLIEKNVVSVETRHALSLLRKQQTIGQNRFQNQGKNTVSSIVGGYKSAVTKHVRRLGFDFAWQPLFWDHIIRDENEYQRIENYIINNPIKWANDKLNGGEGNVILEAKSDYNEETWMV